MSKANTPQGIQSYVGQRSQLAWVLDEARRREGRQQQLRAQLPPALRERVTISIDADCLLLTAPNNAVAQMLHFQGRKLLGVSGCDRLKVRIETLKSGFEQFPTDSDRPTAISADTARLLRATADDIDDAPLAASLRNLAAHADTTNH